MQRQPPVHEHRDDAPEFIERELMHAERELQMLLGVLKTRRTKTVGNELGHRLERVVRAARDAVVRIYPEESAASRALKELSWKNSRSRLSDVIADTESACTYLAELRLFHGRQRLKTLQQRVQQLQFTLDSMNPPQEEGKTTVGQVKPSAVANESTIFVIMPFAESFSDVWAGAIQRAAKAEGFDAIRVDMINRSSDITDDIIEAISNCRVAIVDVTGANANVMFELGYAFAREKPQIIISQSTDFLPFDIRNLRTLIYRNTWAGIEELCIRLGEFLREIPKPKLKKRRGRTRRSRRTSVHPIGERVAGPNGRVAIS